MMGAILGDMIGSPYEFDRGAKTKDFPLFTRYSTYTDDTVMPLAVGAAFLKAGPGAEDGKVRLLLTQQMRLLGRAFPDAGYGGMFGSWLRNPGMGAYCSFGNGSAMRVSSVAWLYQELECKRRLPEPLLKILEEFQRRLRR